MLQLLLEEARSSEPQPKRRPLDAQSPALQTPFFSLSLHSRSDEIRGLQSGHQAGRIAVFGEYSAILAGARVLIVPPLGDALTAELPSDSFCFACFVQSACVPTALVVADRRGRAIFVDFESASPGGSFEMRIPDAELREIYQAGGDGVVFLGAGGAVWIAKARRDGQRSYLALLSYTAPPAPTRALWRRFVGGAGHAHRALCCCSVSEGSFFGVLDHALVHYAVGEGRAVRTHVADVCSVVTPETLCADYQGGVFAALSGRTAVVCEVDCVCHALQRRAEIALDFDALGLSLLGEGAFLLVLGVDRLAVHALRSPGRFCLAFRRGVSVARSTLQGSRLTLLTGCGSVLVVDFSCALRGGEDFRLLPLSTLVQLVLEKTPLCSWLDAARSFSLSEGPGLEECVALVEESESEPLENKERVLRAMQMVPWERPEILRDAIGRASASRVLSRSVPWRGGAGVWDQVPWKADPATAARCLVAALSDGCSQVPLGQLEPLLADEGVPDDLLVSLLSAVRSVLPGFELSQQSKGVLIERLGRSGDAVWLCEMFGFFPELVALKRRLHGFGGRCWWAEDLGRFGAEYLGALLDDPLPARLLADLVVSGGDEAVVSAVDCYVERNPACRVAWIAAARREDFEKSAGVLRSLPGGSPILRKTLGLVEELAASASASASAE